MESSIRELLELLARWVHVIAGIMWVGNSMLFNWLDRNLVKKAGAKEGHEGEIWLLHSGGFYQVEKMQLEPSEMPEILHWFKWQAGITWISGVCLLVLVYYMTGGAFLVDPTVSSISSQQATALCIGLLVVAWAVYDLLWKSPLGKHPRVVAALCFAMVVAIAYGLCHVLSGRAAVFHVGALLGTVMAGNVWMHIIPSQRQLVGATERGEKPDPAIAYSAKQRSIHNNYITFPLIFTMISNHFPGIYGHPLNWLLLAILMVGGAGVRHFMNIRFTFRNWVPAVTGTVVASVGAIALLTVHPTPHAAAVAQDVTVHPVSFVAARGVIEQRCVVCHSITPKDPAFQSAPRGITFDTPEQIKTMAPLIKARAVDTQMMPLGNKTGMTAEERALLGKWIDQGAVIQ